MATEEEERAEIIRELLELLDEIEADIHWSPYIQAKVARARDLVRKLAAPRKGDGPEGE